MRAINVWAWQEGLPSVPGYARVPVCSDGSRAAVRLDHPGASSLANWSWHVALSFGSLNDLAGKLGSLELPPHIAGEPRRLQCGELQTLAIDCHGSPGRFYPNGLRRGLEVTARNVAGFRDALRDIGLMTASQPHAATDPVPLPPPPAPRPASTIIIAACNTGATAEGSRLLIRLSLEWPGRSVVAFSTTLVYPTMRARATDLVSGGACLPPFALDSGLSHLPGTGSDWLQHEIIDTHVPPERMPLADATAANAKIARDGRIIQEPANQHQPGRNQQADRSAGLVGPPRGNVSRPTRSGHALRRPI